MTWDRILPCGTKFFVPARDLKGKLGETNDIRLPLNKLALDALRAARAYAPPTKPTDFIFQYRDPALTSITDRQMREVARELLVKPGARPARQPGPARAASGARSRPHAHARTGGKGRAAPRGIIID